MTRRRGNRKNSGEADESIVSPHDRLFKGTFGNPRHAGQVLRTTMPATLARHVDFRTLRREDGSFVHENLRGSYSDLLFSARVRGRQGFVYLLFEHQSTSDALMPFRLLSYIVAVVSKYLDEHPGATTIPAVVPVVLHHGRGGWSAATSLDELYDLPAEVLPAFRPYLPSLTFLLDDLATQDDDALRQRAMSSIPTLILWTFRYARDEKDLVEAMRARVKDLLAEIYGMPARKGHRSLAMMMRYILEVTETTTEGLEDFLSTEVATEASEVLMTTAEKLRQQGHREGHKEGRKEGHREGRKEGRKEGLEEGLAKGRRAVLLEQLGLRFGTIPASARATVERADVATLALFGKRILSAKTLAEVLAAA